MDFIKMVDAIQKDKGLTDSDMSKLTGISEYTYYALKKYRIYLSKVAYFSISCVLGLPIEKDGIIENILEENKKIVGLPESNLSIAAECVNPEYLDKMEVELAKLKRTLDTIDDKNKVIASQYKEIERLNKEIESSWVDLNEKIQEAYSNGVREGATKVEIMRASSNQSMILALNEEYSDKIDKLERALTKVEQQYISLYKQVQFFNSTCGDKGVDLTYFEKPLGLIKEEIGMVISEDVMLQVLSCYHYMKMSVEEILQEVQLKREDVENIIKTYKIDKKNNRYILEKNI